MVSKNELRIQYGQASDRAARKVLSELDKHCIHFIEKSPFLVLSSVDREGRLDASPRGGEAGFVKIRSNNKIIIPDHKGNNRIDSLSNIAETRRAGVLFMIPGIDETLRLNGKAYVSRANEDLAHFESSNKAPITCLIIEIEEVFMHCAKALMRSDLWGSRYRIEAGEFPSLGQILKDQLQDQEEPETRADMIRRYQKDL